MGIDQEMRRRSEEAERKACEREAAREEMRRQGIERFHRDLNERFVPERYAKVLNSLRSASEQDLRKKRVLVYLDHACYDWSIFGYDGVFDGHRTILAKVAEKLRAEGLTVDTGLRMTKKADTHSWSGDTWTTYVEVSWP